MTTQVYAYKDRWIRVSGAILWAHFVKSLGYSESLFELFMEQDYFLDIGSGSLLTLFIWEVIRQATLWLDRHHDWLGHTLMRTFLQLLLGMTLPALLIFFAMLLYFRYVLDYDIFKTPWLVIEYRVTFLFLVLINGYYVGYYFYLRFRMAERELEKARQLPATTTPPLPAMPTPSPVQSLLAIKGAKNIPVLIEDLAYCYVRGENYYLKTFDEQHFMIAHTLDELESLLPAANFFRLNRQMVAHFKACAAFKNIENGKLEVTLKPAFQEPVMVSQKKAASFKEWLISR